MVCERSGCAAPAVLVLAWSIGAPAYMCGVCGCQTLAMVAVDHKVFGAPLPKIVPLQGDMGVLQNVVLDNVLDRD